MPPVNADELESETVDRPEAAFTRTRLSDAAADDPEIGCSRYTLPPGGRSFPYHYHAANAEAIYVLEGRGRLRLDDERHAIEAGDYVSLPSGAAGAHRVENPGDSELVYLMMSTMAEPDVTVYPDSEKVGIYVGSPPGGTDARTVEGYFPLDARVDYWTDEPDRE